MKKLSQEESESIAAWIDRRQVEKEENALYNSSTSDLPTEDIEYWSKMQYWTVDECVALSLGKDPNKVKWDDIKKGSASRSEIVKQYNRLMGLISRSLLNNQFNKVKPADFIEWAKSKKIEFPNELEKLIHKSKSNTSINSKRSYQELEKMYEDTKKQKNKLSQEKKSLEAKLKTLLKIIRGLTNDGQLKYNVTDKKSMVPGKIENKTRLAGCPVGHDTIKGYLDEAHTIDNKEELEKDN